MKTRIAIAIALILLQGCVSTLGEVKTIEIPKIRVHLMPEDAGTVGPRDIWVQGVKVGGKWMILRPDVFFHEFEHLLNHYCPEYLHPHKRGEVF
jgi:hypothetical protein